MVAEKPEEKPKPTETAKSTTTTETKNTEEGRYITIIETEEPPEHDVYDAYVSLFYPQGANLYFIFQAKMDSIDEYLEYQYGIMDHIQKAGASMSHHHGIGKMTAPRLEAQIGHNEMEIYRALKEHFDPDHIMNPGGTLGLDLLEDQRRDLIHGKQ